MKSQLVLMRILHRATTPTARSTSSSPRVPVHHTGTAQWDVNHPFHLGVLESQGILQTYMLETADGGAKACLYPCVAFQLHLLFNGNEHESGNKCANTTKREWNEMFDNGPKPIKQPWGSFDFIPKRQNEIIFFQAESSRILFAQLPGGSPRRLIYSGEQDIATQIDEDRTRVYCVGRHSSTILSIAIRPDGLALASAGRDGCIRVWRLSDGTMIAQTMFARWRQPRSPGIGRVSPLKRQNDEIDCAYPALRVVSFFGKSWDVAMGCPSGEARTWTQEVDVGSPLTIKRIAESATLFSGKSPIASLALHVPDSNFPLQQQQDHDDAEDEEYYAARLAMNFQERIAVGTSHGKLIVWTRHKNLGDWSPTWSTSPSSEGASIVCLSFRADGGLLAAAASFSAKQLTDEETEALLLVSPPKKIKRVCERVYLYESLSWACVGVLNFSSQVGSCLFYRPRFKEEDKTDPQRCVSREKVSSCRVLLVATASGPQSHILPEHGLFGYRDGRYTYPRHQRPPAFRKEAKTVRWADLKREQREGGGERHSPACPGDRPVRSAPAVSNAYSTHAVAHRCERERIRPVTADDLLWTPNSPMGRSEARRNAAPTVAAGVAAKSQSRSPPPRSRSRSPVGCGHAVKDFTFQDPYQDPSLLSLRAESVGFSKEYGASTCLWPPRLETRKCVCCSKHARSNELPVPYPMGKVIIQNLRSVAAKKSPSASGKPSLRRRGANLQAARKFTASCASLADNSPTLSRSVTPRLKKKPMTILSMRFDDGPDDDQTARHEGEAFSECGSRLHDEDRASPFQQQQSQIVPDYLTLRPAGLAAVCVKGTGEEETKSEAEEEEVHGGASPSFGVASHPQNATQQQKHHHPKPVIGGERLYATVVHKHPDRGRENIYEPVQLYSKAPEHDHPDATPQYSKNEDNPVQSQQLFMNRPEFVGGENLPDKHIVGGNELEDFLEKERSPLKVMAPAVREMAEERKLVQPEPFSTANLLAKLHEVEQETFSMEAALRVAKLRGIELDEEDEKELRRVFKKESTQTTVTEPKGPEVKPAKPSLRYTQLKKIDDPRVSHPGPFLAARKVRKQIDPKWEDMRTMKPTLSDLWNLKERYAQVCSPSPTDIDHNVMYVGGDRNADDSELNAQREATCRHAWSSQAVYDGCLYKPDQRDPDCGCSTQVQILDDIDHHTGTTY